MGNPKGNNYALVLYVGVYDAPCSNIHFLVAPTPIGLLLGSGGVSELPPHACELPDNVAVIFQQHRPGPPLPKGESYLTIGWKQVFFIRCGQN